MTFAAARYLREVVYLDRANRIRLTFQRFNFDADAFEPVPWTTVVAWRLSLIPMETGTTVGPFTTDDHPDMVDDSVAGVLLLSLGGLDIPPGEYGLRLAVQDALGDWSQVAHEGAGTEVVVLVVRATTDAA